MYYKREDVKAKSKYKKLLADLMTKEDPMSEILKGIEIKSFRSSLVYDHETCKGYTQDVERRTEKRFCRCLSCFGKEVNGRVCEVCKMNTDHHMAKKILNAEFVDFEVPVTNAGDDHIGEIDLVMSFDGVFYALEFKPYWNQESLLRMIAEIITYDAFASKSEAINERFKGYKKGIMFMKIDGEANEQFKQFTDFPKGYAYALSEKEMEIFDRLEISVFCLSVNEEKNAYVVEKLR